VHARLVDWLCDWIAPRRCVGCDTVSRETFCAVCGFPDPVEPDLSGDGVPIHALGIYDGPLAAAIRRLKYTPCPALARPLGAALADVLQRAQPEPTTVLVPVPLHPRRLAERGFNQSALVAAALAERAGLRSRPRLLRRVRETAQQAELDRRARATNVSDAFTLCAPAPPSAILIDDVVTTGATVSACVRVLIAQGTRVIAIVALARTTGRSRIS
jgi:ComF family protein